MFTSLFLKSPPFSLLSSSWSSYEGRFQTIKWCHYEALTYLFSHVLSQHSLLTSSISIFSQIHYGCQYLYSAKYIMDDNIHIQQHTFWLSISIFREIHYGCQYPCSAKYIINYLYFLHVGIYQSYNPAPV